MKHLLVSFALAACAGCASNVGPDGLAVGGPCADVYDCASGSFCLHTSGFPAGTCTTNCDDDSRCAGGSACVDQGTGVCLLPCASDEDCLREGYVCRERERHGTSGNVRVCVGG